MCQLQAGSQAAPHTPLPLPLLRSGGSEACCCATCCATCEEEEEEEGRWPRLRRLLLLGPLQLVLVLVLALGLP